MSEVKVVKKQGLINEDGKVIVPLEYDSITVLGSGVYIAEVSTLNIEEEKPVRNQYYHHNKLIPIKDKSKYHLYTDKGRVVFNEPILDYICNYEDGEKIFGVKTPEGWKLVEFDIEKNIFKTHYSAVTGIIDVCDGYVAVKKIDDGCAIYSLKNWEKVLDIKEAFEISIIKEKGFVAYEKGTGKAGFYNLDGCMIFDYGDYQEGVI